MFILSLYILDNFSTFVKFLFENVDETEILKTAFIKKIFFSFKVKVIILEKQSKIEGEKSAKEADQNVSKEINYYAVKGTKKCCSTIQILRFLNVFYSNFTQKLRAQGFPAT